MLRRLTAQQIGALSQDVTATKTDLGTTKTQYDTLSKDLGMARSELGTLIASNHNEIAELRKLGECDHYEFTATKGQEAKVAAPFVCHAVPRSHPQTAPKAIAIPD